MNRAKIPVSASSRSKTSLFGGLTLRAKLILGNMLIALLAIAILGLYIFYRAEVTNAYQASQLDKSVHDQAEGDLDYTISINGNNLSNFFSTMRENLITIRGTTENLIAQEDKYRTGTYWDASQSLTRLPSGNWDNSDLDAGSIFLPSQDVVSNSVISELNTVKQLDLYAPVLLQRNPDAIAIYFGSLSGETVYYPNINLASILPPDFDVTQRPWFIAAAPAQNPSREAVWSAPYQDAALNGLVITNGAPVFDSADRFRGVIAMDIQLVRITNLVSEIHVGDTGYAFLIDQDNRLIALPEAGYKDFEISPEAVPLGESLDEMQIATISSDFSLALDEMNSGKSGFQTIMLGGTERFIIYRPIPEVNYSLAIVVPTEEMLADAIIAKENIAREALNTLSQSFVIVLAILALALIATLGIGNTLTAPLRELTQSAREITNGNLDVEVQTPARDEIGTLGTALNTMTSTLRELIRSLEQRVASRTQELEQQTLRLRTAAVIARDAASARDLDDLLNRSARLIQDRFGFYHTGVFLLDKDNEYAVLRASPTEAGRVMIENHHQLKVGEVGIVGYAASTGKPRIALDTGQDAAFFDNPLLPNTRSEMALPLIADNVIIGVLDVQSDQAGAFSEEDVAIMQVMADQLATAIEKARLLNELQENVKELERTNQQFTIESWKDLGIQLGMVGYHYDKNKLEVKTDMPRLARNALMTGSVAYSNHADKKDQNPGSAAIPVKLRGQTIGVVNVQFKGDTIPEETIRLIEAVSERLAVAVENARLVQDSQKRASLEYTISQMSNKIGAETEIDAVLKSTVQELGKLLADTEVSVQLINTDGGTPEGAPE